MRIRERIYTIIEPRMDSDSVLSRLYDWLMLAAIIIGIFPLMFRCQYRIFWYFDIISAFCYISDYILDGLLLIIVQIRRIGLPSLFIPLHRWR